MDMIPLDQAAVIRLSKTLTPDMDADAIGGIPSGPGVKLQIPGQTGGAGNLAVFYDKGPVSFRVGGSYSGKFLSIGAIAAAVAATRRPIVILHSFC